MLSITFQDLFILQLEVCTFWPPSLISPTPNPLPFGNHQSVLCIYELSFLFVLLFVLVFRIHI